MKYLRRFFTKTDARCRNTFLRNLVFKSVKTLRAFRARRKRGDHYPAFHFISVTDACNLNCQGCWVSRGPEVCHADIAMVHHLIEEGKKRKSWFYGILGGEPLLYPRLFEIFETHRDCYFQLFTNGLLLDEDLCRRLRKCANVTVLISFEGDATAADVRRGARDVYRKTREAIQMCTSQ